MSKHNKAKLEKAERNKIYALKYKKERKGRQPGQYRNWCRVEGHEPSCSCAYPTREEVIEASRSKR